MHPGPESKNDPLRYLHYLYTNFIEVKDSSRANSSSISSLPRLLRHFISATSKGSKWREGGGRRGVKGPGEQEGIQRLVGRFGSWLLLCADPNTARILPIASRYLLLLFPPLAHRPPLLAPPTLPLFLFLP
jgi:hypothetical protein